jgi:hypothetical protein
MDSLTGFDISKLTIKDESPPIDLESDQPNADQHGPTNIDFTGHLIHADFDFGSPSPPPTSTRSSSPDGADIIIEFPNDDESSGTVSITYARPVLPK